VQSGANISTIGACFTNNSGSAITSLAIQYNGKQFRLGGASHTDRIDFQYSLTATGVSTGTYTAFDALTYTAPSTTATSHDSIVAPPAVTAIGPANINGLTHRERRHFLDPSDRLQCARCR
jgi:hypothetical protein